MPEMTPQELRKMADITADCMRYFLSSRAVATSDNTRAVMQQRANTLRSVAFLLRRVAAGELKPVVLHCKDCIYHGACDTGWPCDISDDDDFCSAGKRKP